MKYHTPVLLKEAVDGLNVQAGQKYIDATLGGGGHTEEIIKRGGIVLGIDQDQDALEFVKANYEARIKNQELKIAKGNFSEIEEIAKENGFEKASGILFDLGLSSNQIDNSGRGFSFMRDEPLDMRMANEEGLTAGKIVNKWSEEALVDLFSRYGEEVKATKIARAVVETRTEEEITSSKQLADIISKVVGNVSFKEIHPATRVFQAIRIAVNDEIENLKKGLDKGFSVLDNGGYMSVISFHSLEDRVVKLFFLQLERAGFAQIINKKPIIAQDLETKTNRRSRSAKLRIIKKI